MGLPLILRVLVGAVLGLLTIQGTRRGYYDLVLLPLVIVEMEHGGPSLFGALGAACVVAVGTGSAFAISLHGKGEERKAAESAVQANLRWGVVTDAAGALSRKEDLKTVAMVAAATAGAVLVAFRSRAPSGLPPLVGLVVAENPAGLFMSCVCAGLLSFGLTVLSLGKKA